MGINPEGLPMEDAEHEGEARLLRKASEGDREALGWLFELCRGRLEILVLFRLGPRMRRRLDPHDVLAEVFIKAMRLQRGCRWESIRAFLAWLRPITDYAIRDLIRRNQSADRYDEKEEGSRWEPVDTGVVSPDKVQRRNERFERLAAAIESLSPDRRKVVLYSLQGIPAKEIGKRMGRTDTAVGVLLHRAMRQLRRLLHDTVSLTLPADRALGFGPGEA
jgi:RNA polymerase sigma-70 factor (ECF subfamily)